MAGLRSVPTSQLVPRLKLMAKVVVLVTNYLWKWPAEQVEQNIAGVHLSCVFCYITFSWTLSEVMSLPAQLKP